MSNSFGRVFIVTTFGESHGSAVGAVVNGCPAGLSLMSDDIQAQLDRRRPGKGKLSSPRVEKDRVEILSGVENDMTLGSPISLLVRNEDTKPSDYDVFKDTQRPSHADFTHKVKYGATPSSGGGRASARETVGRVAAGAVAEKWLRECHGVSIVAWVSAVGSVESPDLTDAGLTRKDVDSTDVRCPHETSARDMAAEIVSARDDDGDSVGGVVSCVCTGVPGGWGDPVFDKLDAMLAAGMVSIPGAKGMDVGSGFVGAKMRGSQHNDLFVQKEGRLGTATNRSGGIQGGISNGEPVVLRVAFKPPATIARPQKTAGYDGKTVTLEGTGRHDPCVVPRAVPVVEAMAALVLADAALRFRAPQG